MKLAALAACAALLTVVNASTQTIPSIDLIYPSPNGTVFDTNCESMVKKPRVQPAGGDARQGAVAPSSNRYGTKKGPGYLRATFAEIGLPFTYKEMQATLTVLPRRQFHECAADYLNVTRFLPLPRSAPRLCTSSKFFITS